MPAPEVTELIRQTEVRFPRARLFVVKGPDKGAEVLLEGQSVVVGSDESCQLRLSDSSVSRKHFELTGGPGGYRFRDLRSTNGVFIEGVQVLEGRLADKARISLGRTELRFEPERKQVQWPLSPHETFGDAFGRSTAMRRLFALLERAAPTDSSLVLEGEMGTGKELLARALHGASSRRNGPFVAVDLSSLPEGVMQTDLFGQELPFQAGKQARLGALEEASGGTLYLEDVSLLPAALQPKLLRALETKEVKRGGKSVKIDVRVVASTHADLEAEVRKGTFREDLYFRLAVFRVRVPPLRERAEDIPGLAKMLAARSKLGQPLTAESLEMLSRHDFPGNVRELRNMVERLAAFPDIGKLPTGHARDSSTVKAGAAMQEVLALPYHDAKERVLESFERSYFTEALRASGGVVTRAAQKVGLPRQSVHRMLRRLGLHSGEE